MNELIKISDVISALVNSNIKEMSKSAQNISEIIYKSILPDTEIYKSILDIISSPININNILSYSIEKFEEFNKEDDNISGSSINNALYKAFRDIEEFHKENNDILNFETYIKNNEEIAYQTNINIENSHNENNICNYKELESDLYFLVKDSIIPEKLLFILNKYKNNKTFLIIIIVLFFSFNIAKDIFYDIAKNALENLILVKSSEDMKTTIINQTINNIIIINDNKPYYYYIETKDENGNIINGYVSKRKYNKLKSNKTIQK